MAKSFLFDAFDGVYSLDFVLVKGYIKISLLYCVLLDLSQVLCLQADGVPPI